MSEVSVLEVLLYGAPIGTLTRVGGDRTLFAFNDAYIADPERPMLSLGFKDQLGELITAFRPTTTKLSPFFSNLLPEGPLRAYLAESAGVNPEREFFLLWALGRDLPGAMTVRPADGEAWPPDAASHAAEPGGDELDMADMLRFSLAGVQLKFSAVLEARGGLTVPVSGIGGDWIVKLPSREFDRVPENEFSMMTLASQLGMDVPPVKLVDLDAIENLPAPMSGLEGQAFAVERFDRLEEGGLVHIEDFAQVFGVYAAEKYKKASYRNIASVLAAEAREADIIEFIARLTFSVLVGNGDMHLKNWSLIYPDRRAAQLSPAYDFVSTVPYIPNERAALNFSRSKDFEAFTADELRHLAAKARLSEHLVIETAMETWERFHEIWPQEKANLPLSPAAVEAIDRHLAALPPLARG